MAVKSHATLMADETACFNGFNWGPKTKPRQNDRRRDQICSFDFPKKGMQPDRNPGYQQQSGVHHQQTWDLYATGLNKNW